MSQPVDPKSTNQVLPWRIPEWFSKTDKVTLESLHKFFDLIVKYNQTLNLISPRTLPVADVIHFADSILASRILYEKAGVKGLLYDIGSGNGFPGIIFGILYPDVNVQLIDVDIRKVEFLKSAIHALGLKNVQAVATPIEKLPDASIEFAVSRGFANLSKSILVTRKVFKPKAVYFHMKSEEWPKEVADIPIQLCSYWLPEHVADYKLPIGEVKFSIVKTTRTAKSD